MEKVELTGKLKIIDQSAEAKGGADIQVLDIRQMTSIADYFVIVSGNSTPQLNAIAEEIEDNMAEAGYETYHHEGNGMSRWIVLDYGDIIVHIFHREMREFYNLERLWTQDFKEETE
ncbi:ribosome-associated protein [Aedoeadaptatus ivorii]|uniref:Ribosomal silencing factor RsfS n=1 Tax=Aedoeadaptatus ivorii TaxID=54006 RepID=A0A3S4Y6Z7_9FIRM|nr:ribosome silencing factor [Peptoniphilus ivorii]VEJ35391.1 ribosome-associated protein [Peptoniphilus ivorii]